MDKRRLQQMEQQSETYYSPTAAAATVPLAMDCEMVGAGFGGKISMLARVSIVDVDCRVIYDKYVKPTLPVVNYRTDVSGIREEDLLNAEDFSAVQAEVSELLSETTVLVGHGVHFDLAALRLTHPAELTRDTALYAPFTLMPGKKPSLKSLARVQLGLSVQEGEHNSVQDAKTVMKLYLKVRER